MNADITLFTAACTGSPKNNVYPNETIITDKTSFAEAVKHDHVCAKYKDYRRFVGGFEYSNCIPMDCDNDHSDDPAEWKTSADVAAAFPGASFYVAYSRNHMKAKGDKTPRPKFHVYFPVERVSDANLYVVMKQQIYDRFPYFDSNAKDAARFLFGSDNGVEFFPGTTTVDKLLPEPITAGSRNSVMSKEAACIIKRYGDTEDAHKRFLSEAKRCVPPLERSELDSIWSSAQKFGKRISSEPGYIQPEDFNSKPDDRIVDFLKRANPVSNPQYPWTDLGAGQLFADCFKDLARYVPARKSWFVYKDGAWVQDTEGLKAMEYCKDVAKSMFQYATEIRDDHKRQEFMKFCAKWQSRKGRETFLKDAQGAYSLSMNAFDTDLFTFNCANGTLHLDTMEFTEHRSSDLLTKKSPAVYNPQARCLRFESFVDEICSGDQDKARFLQKALGYALSGDTQYECFFILFGVTTRNGKGTLCESILHLMGTYGCGMKPESIGTNLYTNSHAPTEDIARLFGMRFVNISEPEKGLVLNASLVKTMTGNDTITARFLNEKSFDFKPTFKMFINTNHKPVINDMPVFLSNRIMIIPFERHFEEDEQDHTLKREFLKPENQSAILNWLIEGYKLLQKEGFNTPPSVRAAVDEYQHESDKILQFVEEMLEKGDDYKVKTMDAYQEYRRWCSDRGYGIENIKNFNQALRRIVDVKQMRPAGGGSPTSMIPGYRLIGRAEPLK